MAIVLDSGFAGRSPSGRRSSPRSWAVMLAVPVGSLSSSPYTSCAVDLIVGLVGRELLSEAAALPWIAFKRAVQIPPGPIAEVGLVPLLPFALLAGVPDLFNGAQWLLAHCLFSSPRKSITAQDSRSNEPTMLVKGNVRGEFSVRCS